MEEMKDIFRLDGKAALVTGGSQGLGFGIARGLASYGADVAILARDKRRLAKAKRSLEKIAQRLWTYSFDLDNIEQIPVIFEQISRESGGIDILVNNAGINVREKAEDFGLESWDKIIRVNLTSVFLLSQCFVKNRIKNKKPGRIINISSLAAERARENIAAYTSSKGGISQLTKSLAVEWAKYNITVNAIGPGYFITEMNRKLCADKNFDSWVKGETPMARWGKPEDLAGAAVFLASEASSFVTGQTLYIDGGWLAKI